MSKNFQFDFDAASRAVKELEDCLTIINQEISKMSDNDMELIRYAWSGDSADSFMEKYMSFAEKLKQTETETLRLSEDLRNTAIRVQAMEEEARRIAVSDGE